jgi:hypothetical protein
MASRIQQSLGTGENTPHAPTIVVLDGFCGVGGNLIQFSKKCGFCIGNDLDEVKQEYTLHNAQIYNCLDRVQVLNKDYLQLNEEDFNYPADIPNPAIDAIFLSPPWGGTGYNLLNEYTLDLIFPDFGLMIAKSL